MRRRSNGSSTSKRMPPAWKRELSAIAGRLKLKTTRPSGWYRQMVVSAIRSFGRLPMRRKPPSRWRVSKKLKYMLSLKFGSPVFSCRYSSAGSSRIAGLAGGMGLLASFSGVGAPEVGRRAPAPGGQRQHGQRHQVGEHQEHRIRDPDPPGLQPELQRGGAAKEE